MDNLKWKSRSRVVAFVDLILSSLGLLLMIVAVCVGTAVTSLIQQHKNDPDVKASQGDINAIIWIMWIVLVIVSVVVLIDLWAAVMLLKVTKEGVDYVNAVKRARIWRNVNIVFFILTLLNFGATTSSGAVIAGLVFRGVILYILCKFIEELEQVIARTDYNNLDNVVLINKE